MKLKRVLIIGFAILSAIALWDMVTFDPDEFELEIVNIEIDDVERNLNPTRPPDFEERRSLPSIFVEDGAGRTVTVDNMPGRLEIGSSESGEISAEYTVRIWGDGSRPARDQAEAVAKEVEVAWVQDGGRARLTLSRPNELPKGLQLLVDVRLRVPHGIDVVAEHTGDVVIEGLSGSVRLGTATGRAVVRQVQGPVTVAGRIAQVNVSRIQGPVNVSLQGGRLDIAQVEGEVVGSVSFGELVLQDVAGDVTFRVGQGTSQVRNVVGNVTLNGGYGETRISGVDGNVAVTQTIGSVRVGVTRSADLMLEMGEMQVYLEGDGGWSVDAVAEMGEIRTGLPLAREESPGRTRLSGTIGDGAHQLKMEVNRGTGVLSRR